MEPVMLSHLFLKVLPTLAKHAGQIALRELNTSVAKAARAAAKEFPFYPDLSSWLADWCASPEFFEVQAACTQGDRITADVVVGSFAKYVGTINPDHARRCAEEVLPAFLRNLDIQELGSVGVAIFDRRSEARHAEVIAGQQEIRDFVATISRQLSQVAPAPVADPPSTNPDDALVNSELDAAKRLLDGGRPHGALIILDATREAASRTTLSHAMRFRLEALTGNYYLATRETARAVEAFNIAISLNPTNARVRANLSTAKALIGKREEALLDAREAHALAATDGFVASVYLRRLLESGEPDAAECFITDHSDFLSDPYFMHAVAEARCGAGRRDEAIDLVRPRLKSELAFVPAWELLGRTVFQRA
jgi:Flp pilus assembly protein TadD